MEMMKMIMVLLIAVKNTRIDGLEDGVTGKNSGDNGDEQW